MRNREKQMMMVLLEEEKKLFQELEEVYERALDQINQRIKALQADPMNQSKIYRRQYQEELRDQVTAILTTLQGNEYETIQEYLKESYVNGFVSSVYSMYQTGFPVLVPLDQAKVVKALTVGTHLSGGLYKRLGVDVNALKNIVTREISRGMASGMGYREMARNISNQAHITLKKAKTIVRTQAHRIQEASSQDAREAAAESGARVVKQWDATMDARTRRTHAKLDGQVRDVDKPFEVDGKEAMYPGGFGRPDEDINCRCVALTRAEWGLDEDELKTMQERADFFGLDKKDQFEDFKKKYLKNVKE